MEEAKDEKKGLLSTFKTIRILLGFLGPGRTRYVILKAFSALLNSAVSIFTTIFPGLIIKELTGDQEIAVLVIYTCALTMLPLVHTLINSVLNIFILRWRLQLSVQLNVDFFRHVITMDYETLESPTIQVKQEIAERTIYQALDVVDELINMGGILMSLTAVFAIIASLNVFLIFLVVLSIFLNAGISKRLHKQQYLTQKARTQEDRKKWSLIYVLENSRFAKEIRLFQTGEMLLRKLQKVQERIETLQVNYTRTRDKAILRQAIINCTEHALVYAYLIYSLLKGVIDIGGLTIYLSATNQFFVSLKSVVDAYLQLNSRSFNTQELVEFLDIPARQLEQGHKTPVLRPDSVIEFRNVSFQYPGSERYALRHLNLTWSTSERLCIVGHNGAGKTTFIKLLTRLYFPTEGEILLDGVDIQEFDYKEYQRLFAPVFQDFSLFWLSFQDNIILDSPLKQEKLDQIIEEAGLKSLVNKLPNGYDTQVWKWIDENGFDPSGGEAQRMAIARACYHGASIFLLDEPTAALDPVAEHEIYTQFNNMITDKGAVLITHRLSAVQLAHKVAVFAGGEVAEYGTHKELYAKNGLYTEMFDKQSQFYRQETE